MPATYAHYRFGQAVLATLPAELAAQLGENKALFSLGLHGPDLLWYDQFSYPSKSATKSTALHFSSARPFFEDCRARWANTKEAAQARAYLVGFLCHFALDSTAHPYVNRLAVQGPVTHLSLESEFDKALLRKDAKDPFTTNLTAHIRPNATEMVLVAELLQTSVNAIARSVASMHHHNALSRPEHAAARDAFLADLASRGISEGYAGLLLAPQDDARCAKSNTRLTVYFNQAIPRACALIAEYWAAWQGDAPLSAVFEPTYE